MKNKITQVIDVLKRRDRKTVVIAASLAFAILAITSAAFIPAGSQSATGGGGGRQSLLGSIIDKISGSDTDDTSPSQNSSSNSGRVTEEREEIEAAFRRLERAIENERIIGEQAKLVRQKLEDTEKFYEEISDKPATERKELVNKKRSELREWAHEHDIAPQYVRI